MELHLKYVLRFKKPVSIIYYLQLNECVDWILLFHYPLRVYIYPIDIKSKMQLKDLWKIKIKNYKNIMFEDLMVILFALVVIVIAYYKIMVINNKKIIT